MARTYVACCIALCVALLWPGAGIAGDVFTGYQIDHQGQYYTYLGVRKPHIGRVESPTVHSSHGSWAWLHV